ncbi:MAG: FAD-binding domain-containing protein [Paracoccaceae bacterium]
MIAPEDLFAGLSTPPEKVVFEPTRRAGLARLEKFASRTGTHYATRRNYDLGPSNRSAVSSLSPWIRHRLITEEEVLIRTLARHSPTSAMKFIQEVFWRGYFKGWLEQHPSVWHSYQAGLQTAQNSLEGNAQLNVDYISAIDGRTGIECFDHWCRELKETGYLHNHARMWFASIWIFTLRLPWELGSEFFLCHLIDGDPAANTLSWRWVGGLHTKGKTYLARPDNIAKYTGGAFEPIGQLAKTAEPLTEDYDHPLVPITAMPDQPYSDHLLLITAEDCWPDDFISDSASGVLGLSIPLNSGQSAQERDAFAAGAIGSSLERLGAPCHVSITDDWGAAIIAAAQNAGTKHVVTPFAPVGPVATKLAQLQASLTVEGITLHQQRRLYDTHTWPHATQGFFKLKKMIPTILTKLGHSHVESL